jgi:hypothetical protein
VGGPVLGCDDGDRCTTDRCLPETGCSHVPADGTCWDVEGTVTLTASVAGRRVRERADYTDEVLLLSDGTYRLESGDCPGKPTLAIPAEEGTWREGRRRKTFLEPANLDALVSALATCISEPSFTLKKQRPYRHWLRVKEGKRTFCRWRRVPADGDHVCGRAKLRATVRIQGRRVNVTAAWRYSGARRTP